MAGRGAIFNSWCLALILVFPPSFSFMLEPAVCSRHHCELYHVLAGHHCIAPLFNSMPCLPPCLCADKSQSTLFLHLLHVLHCNRQIDTKAVYREKDNTLGCSVRVSHIFIGAIFRNITPCLLILFIPWHINKSQPLNSFLQELCKSPFIQSEICTSPHWHCSANAGKRTPPLPLCKHHELRAATEAALSLSLSLPLFLSVPLSLTCVLSCSLLKHLSSHFCLTIISSSPS